MCKGLWAEYKDVVQKINQAYDEFGMLTSEETMKLDEFNLTYQQDHILTYIMRNKNTTVSKISASFSISKSAVSQPLSNLEQRAFIIKEVNPDNRRENYIKLGPRGFEYENSLSRLEEILIKKYYSKIEINELKNMADTMVKLNQIIKNNTNLSYK